MPKTRTLFLGTSEFAVTILQNLLTVEEIEIVGVVTQPDKPVGRTQRLQMTPVAEFAETHAISVEKPAKLRLVSTEILRKYRPELVIVAAYGQLIPADILYEPKYKALNVHGSLLPELRGAVPVQMAILAGLSKTGITIQQMVEALDAGPIVATREYILNGEETTATLMPMLAQVGAELLLEVLPRYLAGEINLTEQSEAAATYCYQADLAKDKAEIKFTTPVEVAARMVRAFEPWPIAWLYMGAGEYVGLRVKIFRVGELRQRKVDNFVDQGGERGLAFLREGKRLFLLLAAGELEVLELQLEGKQRRNAEEYLYLGM